jgi:hypothetical protein
MLTGIISNTYEFIWGSQKQTPTDSTREALESLDRRLNGYFWEKAWCLSSTLYEVQKMNQCLKNLSVSDWQEGGFASKARELQTKVSLSLKNRGEISGILAFFSKLLNTYWNQEFNSSDRLGARLLKEGEALIEERQKVKISLKSIENLNREKTEEQDIIKLTSQSISKALKSKNLFHVDFLSSLSVLKKLKKEDVYHHAINTCVEHFSKSHQLLEELTELIDLIKDEDILSLPSNEKKIARMLGYEFDKHLSIVYDIGNAFFSMTLSLIMTGETFKKCCAILSLLPRSNDKAKCLALSLPFYLAHTSDDWKATLEDILEITDSELKKDALGFMVALALKYSDIPLAIHIATSLKSRDIEESSLKKLMLDMCTEFAPEKSGEAIRHSNLSEEEQSEYLTLCEEHKIMNQNLLKGFLEIISLSNSKEKQEKFVELSGKIICKGDIRAAIKETILKRDFCSKDENSDFWFAEMASAYIGNNELLEALTFTLIRSEIEDKDRTLLLLAKKFLDFHEVGLAKQSLQSLSAEKRTDFQEILTKLENVLPIREEIDQIRDELFDLMD